MSTKKRIPVEDVVHGPPVRPFYWRERVTHDCTGDSATKQSFTDECNINFIVAKFQKTGEFSHVTKAQPHYGDFSGVRELAEMIDQVDDAMEQFDQLPAAIRELSGNDPVRLLEIMASEEGHKALQEAERASRSGPVPVDLRTAVQGLPGAPEEVPATEAQNAPNPAQPVENA